MVVTTTGLCLAVLSRRSSSQVSLCSGSDTNSDCAARGNLPRVTGRGTDAGDPSTLRRGDARGLGGARDLYRRSGPRRAMHGDPGLDRDRPADGGRPPSLDAGALGSGRGRALSSRGAGVNTIVRGIPRGRLLLLLLVADQAWRFGARRAKRRTTSHPVGRRLTSSSWRVWPDSGVTVCVSIAAVPVMSGTARSRRARIQEPVADGRRSCGTPRCARFAGFSRLGGRSGHSAVGGSGGGG